MNRRVARAWIVAGGLAIGLAVLAAPLAAGGAAVQRAQASKPPARMDPREIVAEAQRRAAVDSQHYEGVLRVKESNGKVSDKRWVYDRLGSNGGSKTVIRFSDPAEVRGVAILIFNYPDRASDQWMWTPALNRDRRIATQDRRTRFFGTDFSFEDLEERDVARYDYTLVGDDTIEGDACWKLDSTPKAGVRSQYTHSVLWIRKSNYTYAQIDNFGSDALIRRLNYRNVAVLQGIATARAIDVRDFTRNSQTTLTLDQLKYHVPLKESQFTIDALRHG